MQSAPRRFACEKWAFWGIEAIPLLLRNAMVLEFWNAGADRLVWERYFGPACPGIPGKPGGRVSVEQR